MSCVIDDMKVVEDEDDIPVDAVQFVDERRQHGIRRRVRRIQERACVRAEAGHRQLERREDVRPERRRIVVALVEGEPRHRGAVVGDRAQPCRDERGLAETGGRRDEDQLRVGRARQARLQPRARDQVAPRRRDVELRLDQQGTGSAAAQAMSARARASAGTMPIALASSAVVRKSSVARSRSPARVASEQHDAEVEAALDAELGELEARVHRVAGLEQLDRAIEVALHGGEAPAGGVRCSDEPGVGSEQLTREAFGVRGPSLRDRRASPAANTSWET